MEILFQAIWAVSCGLFVIFILLTLLDFDERIEVLKSQLNSKPEQEKNPKDRED